MDWIARRCTYSMIYIKAISKYPLAFFMVGAGTMHFIKPDFYLIING